jgi:hypothetical protein
MFSKTLLGTLTAAAIAAGSLGLSTSSASATYYGGGLYFGGDNYGIHFKYVPKFKKVCKLRVKKILVGYDYWGDPIFKWKKFKKCKRIPVYAW